MIILDTNVLSELLRPRPDGRVIAWFDAQPEEELFTTAITVQESFYGAELLPDSPRKSSLMSRLEQMYDEIFAGRILPFDDISARYTAVLLGHSRRNGVTIHQANAQIAGIVAQHGAALATRNTRDFERAHIRIADPWN